MNLKERIEKTASAAEDAFWETVASRFPEIKTGDLCPMTSMQFSDKCEKVIRAWIEANTGGGG